MSSNDGFLDHLPAIIAAALGAVGTSVGLSYFGVAGTLLGLILGTLVTGTIAWYAERLIRRGQERARAVAEARKRKGAPLTDTETQYIHAVADERHKRRWGRIPWQVAALGGGAVLGLAGLVLVVIALSVGRPVGAIVRPPVHTHKVTPPATQPAVVPTTPASSSIVPTTAPPTTIPPTTPAPTPDATGGGTATATPPPAVPTVTASPSPS